VAQHDLPHLRRIGRAAAEGRGHLAEIAGAEHAWGQHAEAGGWGLAVVAETMHDAAPDEHRLAGGECDVLAVDPPDRGAGEAVYQFVPALVVMRHRHAGIRLRRHLERVEAAAGRLAGVQEAEFEAADADGLRHGVAPVAQ
jgi:hypothetical protein